MHSATSYPGFYRAVVVDHSDPEGLGRLKLKIPQVSGEEVTDWAWPVLGGVSQFKPVYGQWQDDLTQTIASTTTAYPVLFRTLDQANGISVVSDSRITLSYPGTYNIQFSFQFQNTDTQLQDVSIWTRINGVDVPGSTGEVSVPNTHGGVPGHTVVGWNYIYDLNVNDYVELVWNATSTQVTLQAYAAGTTPTTPTAPSAAVTISAIGNVIPVPESGVWAAFEGGDPNFPLWIGTF